MSLTSFFLFVCAGVGMGHPLQEAMDAIEYDPDMNPGDIFLIVSSATSQEVNGPFEVVFINSTTGKLTKGPAITMPKKIPPLCKNPGWTILGTHGQSSTVFAQNRSLFFTSQLSCNGEVSELYLLSMFVLPYANPNPIEARIWTKFNSSTHLVKEYSRWNIAWDWVCNVIVLAPSATMHPQGTVFETLMISEFDGAVRPQKPYLIEPPTNHQNGWVKVDGLGGIDFDGESTGGPYQLNCGKDCVQYSLEEMYVGGVRFGGRRLIGRNFHTAKLEVNTTATLDIRTLTYYAGSYWENEEEFEEKSLPFFLGLGYCCTDKWCIEECAKTPNALVLFSYETKKEITLLKVLSEHGDQHLSDDSIRLGVHLSYDPSYRPGSTITAQMMVNMKIVSYEIQRQPNGQLLAIHPKTSADIELPGTPLLWTGSSFY